MAIIENISTGTNGGANRFWIEDKGDDAFVFRIAGSDVSGRYQTTDINAFVNKAARLFDGKVEKSGNLSIATLDEVGGDDPNINVNASNEVTVGGEGVSGGFRWQFDDAQDAQNFADFLDLLI